MARRSTHSLGWLLLGLGLLGGGLYVFLELGGGRGRTQAGLDVVSGTGDREDSEGLGPAEDRLLPPPRVLRSEASSGATTVLWPLRVELNLVEPSYLPKEVGLTPIGSGATARLSGHILEPGRSGTPDRGARAQVRFVAGPNEGRVLETDDSGTFGASDLFPGLSVVKVVGPGLIGARREVRLRQQKDTLLNIAFGRPGAIQGRVQDSEGVGIEGAELDVDGRKVISGPDGTFYAGPVAAGQVLVEVSHPDYARYQELVWVSTGLVSPVGTVNFTLEPAAQLVIAIQGDVGGPGPAQVYLVPGQPARRIHADSIYRNVRYPFHERNPIEIWPGIPKTIDGLPAEVVQVHVFRPGAQAASKHANLRQDRPVEMEIRLKAAPRVTGKVTRDGEPVARAKVTLEAPNRVRALLGYLREGAHYLESAVLPSFPPARQEALTDAQGRFTFTAYEEQTPTRYLEARGPDGSGWAGRLVHRGDREVDLELDEAELADSELRIDFTDRIQGLPVEVWIDGSPVDSWVLPRGEELVLTPLMAGRWHLEASWRGEPVIDETISLSGSWAESYRLPQACIDGQDEETWLRAGREFPR